MKKASKNSFIDYLINDLFSSFRGITHRAMFGGYVIYKNGVIFAIVAYDKLYFKVDESNIEDYKKAGSGPFTYKQKGHKQTSMSYWELPAEVMEDKEALRKWLAKAYKINKNKKK